MASHFSRLSRYYFDCGQRTKKVSSTLGHALMQDHPFATQRFEQAHKNLGEFKRVLIAGDLERFIDLVESEALCLHAMMMTSNPHFVLMQPNTLSIIEKVEDFRLQTQLPICFTLDAGANVHLLYPLQHRIPIMDFIREAWLSIVKKDNTLRIKWEMVLKKF